MIWDALEVIGIAFLVFTIPAILALGGGARFSPKQIKRMREEQAAYEAASLERAQAAFEKARKDRADRMNAPFAEMLAKAEAQRKAWNARFPEIKSRQG